MQTCSFQDLETTRQNYIALHKRMLSPETPLADKRYIVFVASNDGLGNRIQGLLSTFLFALVTDRALLVEWVAQDMSAAGLNDLFDEPGFEWTSPTGIGEATALYARSNLQSATSPPPWIGYCRTCTVRSEDMWRDTYTGLLCDKDLGHDPIKEQVIKVRSTQWYAPAIAHNPAYRDKVRPCQRSLLMFVCLSVCVCDCVLSDLCLARS